MLSEKQVPKRIRKMRLERQLTQQALADAVGVTKGYISRIENSDTAPPVGTLISIAQALGVDFSAFFGIEESETIMTLTREDQRTLVASDKTAELKYAHLSMKFPNRAMEPYIITAPPAGKLSQRMQHKGQEFWFVLRGEFEVQIDDQVHIIKKGDTIYFNSGYYHRGRCLSEDGGELMSVIWNADKDG